MNEYVECAFKQYAKRSNCVAFCKKHRCYLTISHLKNMQCLQKQCRYLIKEENHKYWIKRNEKKNKKKIMENVKRGQND